MARVIWKKPQGDLMGKDLWLEFNLEDPHRGRRKPIPASYSLTCAQRTQHVCTHRYTSQLSKQKNVSQARLRKDCFYTRKENDRRKGLSAVSTEGQLYSSSSHGGTLVVCEHDIWSEIVPFLPSIPQNFLIDCGGRIRRSLLWAFFA